MTSLLKESVLEFTSIPGGSVKWSSIYRTQVLKKLRMPLVVHGLGIHLPMQRTWVRSIIQEDSTCREGQLSPCATVIKPELFTACALQERPPP